MHCENKEAIRQAKDRFNNWVERGVRVPPNLREVVYSAGKTHSLLTMIGSCKEGV